MIFFSHDGHNSGGQHLGVGDRPAEAEAQDRGNVKVVRIGTQPVDRGQQERRQDDACPPLRRENGDAEADVGVGVHLRKEEQSASCQSKLNRTLQGGAGFKPI